MIYTETQCRVLKESFPFMQKVMKENFNIVINDSVEYVNQWQYRVQGDFIIDVSIISDFAVRFDFMNILYFDNGILHSRLDTPVLDSILMNINSALPVLSAIRLADDENTFVFSVIDNIKPILMISYNKMELDETYESIIKVLFDPVVPTESDKSFSFVTGSSLIQAAYEYCGFKMFYTLEGESTHNDLEVYKNRVSKAWNLTETNNNIDYKQLGLLTDMLYI